MKSSVDTQVKLWTGPAKPADLSRLYLAQDQGGLGLLSISCLYMKAQVGRAALPIISDKGIEIAYQRELEHETQSQILVFKPTFIVQQEFAEKHHTSFSLPNPRGKFRSKI